MWNFKPPFEIYGLFRFYRRIFSNFLNRIEFQVRIKFESFNIFKFELNYNFKLEGQYKLPGIVSCIAFSPNSSVYAVGTYSKYSID
jgi:hypothetical protein